MLLRQKEKMSPRNVPGLKKNVFFLAIYSPMAVTEHEAVHPRESGCHPFPEPERGSPSMGQADLESFFHENKAAFPGEPMVSL